TPPRIRHGEVGPAGGLLHDQLADVAAAALIRDVSPALEQVGRDRPGGADDRGPPDRVGGAVDVVQRGDVGAVVHEPRQPHGVLGEAGIAHIGDGGVGGPHDVVVVRPGDGGGDGDGGAR